jgi:hypothetical protein
MSFHYLPDKLLQAYAIADTPGSYNHNCHPRTQEVAQSHVSDDGAELDGLKRKTNNVLCSHVC